MGIRCLSVCQISVCLWSLINDIDSLARILRSLTASGIFSVTSLGTYKPDAVVKDLASGGYLESRILMNL